MSKREKGCKQREKSLTCKKVEKGRRKVNESEVCRKADKVDIERERISERLEETVLSLSLSA